MINTNPPQNKDQNIKTIWDDAYSDIVAGIQSFSSNISLSDIMADGDFRLICADVKCKLKVFKGPVLQNEANLIFTPVSIASFYAPDTNTKNCVPYLAVSGGPYIFIYKNVKGTFKFLIPNLEPNAKEVALWSEMKENKIDYNSAVEKLQELSDQKVDLSTRSYEVLSLKDEKARNRYIDEKKNLPIVTTNYVTCMTTLKKNNADDFIATSNIVVGTECGLVYIIDHSGSKIIHKFRLPNVPVQIIALGACDVDYRLHIVARNSVIYTIKNGELLTVMINLPSKIFGMARTDKSIAVGTLDNFYHSYNPQGGKKNFSIKLPDAITCIDLLDCKKTRNFKGILISLKNCELRLYNEKNLISLIKTNEVIIGLKFGRFGKEEETLILISESGSLFVKTLKKNINLESLSHQIQKKGEDDSLLNVPKKTKLYLDLMEREKEFASNMNQVFQNDLIRLRHRTLDTYVKMLKIGNAPQNYSTTSKVKLTASLQGLGPNFRLNLIVDNSGDEVISSTDLIVEYDRSIFFFEKESIQLGLIMPSVPMKYSMKFKNISENGSSGNIKILIVEKSRTSPLVTSTIKVPISEVEII